VSLWPPVGPTLSFCYWILLTSDMWVHPLFFFSLVVVFSGHADVCSSQRKRLLCRLCSFTASKDQMTSWVSQLLVQCTFHGTSSIFRHFSHRSVLSCRLAGPFQPRRVSFNPSSRPSALMAPARTADRIDCESVELETAQVLLK